MIRRFGIKAASGFSKLENTYGAFVTFDDAEADKAAAVAEIIVELADCLELLFRAGGYSQGLLKLFKGYKLFEGGCDGTVWADKLVTFGRWERLPDEGDYQCYQPVEQEKSNG